MGADRNLLEQIFEQALRGTSEPPPSDGWDAAWLAHAEARQVEGVVTARVDRGWRVEIFGLAGFLADDAILASHARAHAAHWSPGTRVRVSVLKLDRDRGLLSLWIRTS